MKGNHLTLTLCSQLGSKESVPPFALPFHFDHDSLPPFSNAVTFEKHNPTWSVIIAGKGYREITGPTLATCSTSHHISPRNDAEQKIGVLLSQSACRTVTMGCPAFGHHFSLSYTETLFSPITEEDKGSQRTPCLFFLFSLKMRDKKKKTRRDEKMTEVLYRLQSSISPIAPYRGTNWSWK